MEWLKKYSKKSFLMILILILVSTVAASIVIYYGIAWLLARFPDNAGNEALLINLLGFLDLLKVVTENFYMWVVPAVFFVFLILGLILWLILKNSASKIFSAMTNEQIPRNSKGGKKEFVDHKTQQDRKRRLYLHSLSVLQRDGRLLDFMNEDLSQYDDEQVGAAVRSIQEDCRKTIKKYVNLQPVMNENEDDVVNIDAGFDMDAIKLVGNVIGDPPFEGVVKHRGWKAGRKEIPQLADIHDSTIIVPAEVEVQ